MNPIFARIINLDSIFCKATQISQIICITSPVEICLHFRTWRILLKVDPDPFLTIEENFNLDPYPKFKSFASRPPWRFVFMFEHCGFFFLKLEPDPCLTIEENFNLDPYSKFESFASRHPWRFVCIFERCGFFLKFDPDPCLIIEENFNLDPYPHF